MTYVLTSEELYLYDEHDDLDGWEDYFQPLGYEYAKVLEENFWDLVLK